MLNKVEMSYLRKEFGEERKERKKKSKGEENGKERMQSYSKVRAQNSEFRIQKGEKSKKVNDRFIESNGTCFNLHQK